MKKGFTLIELLAVIIILAILMIIAVPNILSTLSTARGSAFIAQAQSIYKAAEQQYILDSMNGTNNSCYDKSNLNLSSVSETITFNVTMNNSSGSVSSITVSDSGQQLKASGTTINDIALTTYANETLSCSGSSNNNNNNNTPAQPTSTFGGTKVNATTGDTHKGIVYLDPKDLTATCTSTSTLTTTNTGCKKFYIFDDSGDSYKMLMWKNTSSGNVAWNSNNVNTSMLEVAAALSSDTSGWEGSPRLITADEVAGIVDNGSWSSTTATTSNYFYFGSKNTTGYSSQTDAQKTVQQSYHWLFDYTYNCTSHGCSTADSSTYGYWTSNAVSGSSYGVWGVYNIGRLSSDSAVRASSYGVRPVIEIAKSIIS